MRYSVNNILCYERHEFKEVGCLHALDKAKARNSPSWGFEPGHFTLVDVNRVPDWVKAKLVARFGEPDVHLRDKRVRDLIKHNNEAELFYLGYRYTNSIGEATPLPTDHVARYTKASNVLEMLKKGLSDKAKTKEMMGSSVEDFWVTVARIIEKDEIDLPTSYKRLNDSLKKYIRDGYASLIDWRFGKQSNNVKVKDEVSKAMLEKLLANPLQFDDVLIMMKYNEEAKKAGYSPISKSAVTFWRKKLEANITMEREGNAAFKQRFIPDIRHKRPNSPLTLVESDDYVANWLFTNPDNLKAEHRYVIIMVKDVYNDLVLGASFAQVGTLSEGASVMLIKAAYMDAMYYIKELTGAWHIFDEIKTDHWALTSLKPFYEKLARYQEAGIKNKNRGYIEQSFGHIHTKRAEKLSSPDFDRLPNNYNGNNVDAKNRGVNMQWLRGNKKYWPTIGAEAEQQCRNFIHRLRHMPQSNGVSKQQQWVEAWNNTAIKRQLSDEQFLLKFGIEHNPTTDRTNRITNKGLNPIIGDVRCKYTLEGEWRQHIGKQVRVIYDPYDMTRVLVTDHQQVRLMGRDTTLVPIAQADHNRDSRVYMQALMNEKRDVVRKASDHATKRDQILVEAGFDHEAVMLSGNLEKPKKLMAEGRRMSHLLNPGKSTAFVEEDYFEGM